jgi:Leucine-rich repeat (LRR) protein
MTKNNISNSLSSNISNSLPEDIICIIFKFLSVEDCINFLSTCSKYILLEGVWMDKLGKFYIKKYKNINSYKEIFKIKYCLQRVRNCFKLNKSNKILIGRSEFILSDKRIPKIPNSICLFKNLTNLTLSNNKIRNIPSSLSQLINLSRLDLSYNPIRTVNITLPNLTHLNISGLSLTEFPDLSKLITLRILKLSDTNLKFEGYDYIKYIIDDRLTITNDIFKLTNLENVSLAACNLSCIPNEISLFKKLRKLNISHNHLNTLGKNYSQLDELNASHNRISSVPSWISNLQSINLGYNPLKTFSLNNIGKLKTIEIAKCEISHMPNLPYKDLNYVNMNFNYFEGDDSIRSYNYKIDVCMVPEPENIISNTTIILICAFLTLLYLFVKA